MPCPRCGAKVPGGARACARCGAKVTDPGAQTVAVATEARGPDPLLLQLRRELAADYEVEEELGRGAMGVVYRATEIELRRPVALKVLPPHLGLGASAERFRREARMAAALDHPSIIPIYRVGQAAHTYYFAMKFVEGRALDAILEAQGALPLPVILAILRATAGALAFAHDHDIVHRDIKGANILVDRDGRVLVSDFGIARAAQEKTLTAAGSVIGTPYYMSPEQGWGGKVGPQSDQYSLGILTFQMLTGSVPFDGDSLMAILQHHYFTPVPDVRAVREGVPAGLVTVMETALAKNPAYRYATTREMLAAIEAIPRPEAERREADGLLRELARGDKVPKVRTASLPPLGDTHLASLGAATLTSAKTATPRGATQRRGRRPVLLASVVMVAVIALAGAWWLARHRVGSGGQNAPAAATPRPQSPAAPLVTGPGAGPAPTRQAATDSSGAAAAQHAARGGRGRAASRETAPVAAPLSPPPAATGLLRLRTIPPTAQIFVDGRPVAVGALVDFEIAAGSRQIRITAPGFVTLDTTIVVGPGATVRLGQVTLRGAEGGP